MRANRLIFLQTTESNCRHAPGPNTGSRRRGHRATWTPSTAKDGRYSGRLRVAVAGQQPTPQPSVKTRACRGGCLARWRGGGRWQHGLLPRRAFRGARWTCSASASPGLARVTQPQARACLPDPSAHPPMHSRPTRHSLRQQKLACDGKELTKRSMRDRPSLPSQLARASVPPSCGEHNQTPACGEHADMSPCPIWVLSDTSMSDMSACLCACLPAVCLCACLPVCLCACLCACACACVPSCACMPVPVCRLCLTCLPACLPAYLRVVQAVLRIVQAPTCLRTATACAALAPQRRVGPPTWAWAPPCCRSRAFGSGGSALRARACVRANAPKSPTAHLSQIHFPRSAIEPPNPQNGPVQRAGRATRTAHYLALQGALYGGWRCMPGWWPSE